MHITHTHKYQIKLVVHQASRMCEMMVYIYIICIYIYREIDIHRDNSPCLLTSPLPSLSPLPPQIARSAGASSAPQNQGAKFQPLVWSRIPAMVDENKMETASLFCPLRYIVPHDLLYGNGVTCHPIITVFQCISYITTMERFEMVLMFRNHCNLFTRSMVWYSPSSIGPSHGFTIPYNWGMIKVFFRIFQGTGRSYSGKKNSVGGFNPSEKYQSIGMMNFPTEWKNKVVTIQSAPTRNLFRIP